MKIVKHAWLPGILNAVGPSTIKSSLSADSKPSEYTKADGTVKQYHWAKVVIQDNNGKEISGSAMIPNELFKKNPADFSNEKSMDIAIQLNGEGAGFATTHLDDGKFDVANLVDADELAGFAEFINDDTPVAQ